MVAAWAGARSIRVVAVSRSAGRTLRTDRPANGQPRSRRRRDATRAAAARRWQALTVPCAGRHVTAQLVGYRALATVAITLRDLDPPGLARRLST